ncbi:MAG: hypothetical protein AABY92_00985, partial [Thermodesulfobacteriota bacterium]
RILIPVEFPELPVDLSDPGDVVLYLQLHTQILLSLHTGLCLPASSLWKFTRNIRRNYNREET